jgi:hypothetical protein
MKLINISNHNSNNWSKEQKEGFDEIIDVQFPNIPANATIKDVILTAYDLLEKLTNEISTEDALHIMLQGEFTLCYKLKDMLDKAYWTVNYYIPTTERKVVEKTTIFQFVQWRVI